MQELQEMKSEKLKNFGLFIKYERFKIGLTQQELANRMGCTRQLVCRFEKGKNNPMIKKQKELARALKISVKELRKKFEEC